MYTEVTYIHMLLFILSLSPRSTHSLSNGKEKKYLFRHAKGNWDVQLSVPVVNRKKAQESPFRELFECRHGHKNLNNSTLNYSLSMSFACVVSYFCHQIHVYTSLKKQISNMKS